MVYPWCPSLLHVFAFGKVTQASLVGILVLPTFAIWFGWTLEPYGLWHATTSILNLTTTYLYILALQGVANQSFCSPGTSDSTQCLQAIRRVMTDNSAFWFGDDYFQNCPPEKQGTINCYKPGIPEGFNLLKALSGPGSGILNENNLDRLLDVTYHSEPGI